MLGGMDGGGSGIGCIKVVVLVMVWNWWFWWHSAGGNADGCCKGGKYDCFRSRVLYLSFLFGVGTLGVVVLLRLWWWWW